MELNILQPIEQNSVEYGARMGGQKVNKKWPQKGGILMTHILTSLILYARSCDFKATVGTHDCALKAGAGLLIMSSRVIFKITATIQRIRDLNAYINKSVTCDIKRLNYLIAYKLV